jgi:Hypervirulence associated proteins TUDOR domain
LSRHSPGWIIVRGKCRQIDKEAAMAKELRIGDRVEWNFGRGKAIGTVQRKLTEPTTVSGQRVAASADDPRYLVRTERSGKAAAKRPGSLRKLRSRRSR